MPVEAYTPAQVVTQARGRLERPLLGMVSLGIAAFCLATGSLVHFVCAALAVGVNLAVMRRQKEVYLHRSIVTAAVIVATIQLIAETVLSNAGEATLLSLQRYLVVIQLCKLFQQKGNRDYVHLMTTSVLLVVSVTLECRQAWLLPLLVAYLALGAYSAMAFTIKRGLDAVLARRLVTEPAPPPPQRVAWNAIHRWPRGLLLKRTAAAALVLGAFGATALVLAPRAGGGGGLGAVPHAISGPGETVSLDSPERLKLSNEVLLRVRPGAGSPVPAYLRGRVFDVYERSRWHAGPRETGPEGFTSQPAPGLPAPRGPRSVEVWMAAGLAPRAYAPATTIALGVARGQALGKSGGEWGLPPESIQANAPHVHYCAWFLPEPVGAYDLGRLVRPLRREEIAARLGRMSSPWAYLRQNASDREKQAMAPALTPAQVRAIGTDEPLGPLRAFQGTPGRLSKPQADAVAAVLADPQYSVAATPLVAQLARQWCQDLLRTPAQPGEAWGDPLAVAQRLRERLTERCRYSTDLTDADPARDGVEDFLFAMKRGHCEYFASALTVMCRSLSIRARLATGFAVPLEEARGGDILVRGRHAHAWTEVYTNDGRWVVVDATPGAGDAAEASWWSQWADRWQGWRFDWQEGLWGLDPAAQARLREWIYDRWSDVRAAASEALSAVGDGLVELTARGQVTRAVLWLGVAAAVLAAAVAALIVARALWRRTATARRVHRRLGRPLRDLRFMTRLLALLRRRRLVRRPGETPRDLLRRASAALGWPAPALTGLVDLYYRLRWGPPGDPPGLPAQLAAAERLVDQLARGPRSQ
ncbi:MAG: transglutaminaseTgpA domain-containing protein [Planctomycetota bacterium]|nr:transglutaminaseTgpA domain-containing protein [Planctomycetota bacterium]